MEKTDQILKQDAAGRVWTPRTRREAVLDEFERSGLPATKFAAGLGVKYPTFISWVQKRRKARAAAGEGEPGRAPVARVLGGWVEAQVEVGPERPGRALTVHLPGGARLEVSNGVQAGLAAELLRALAQGAVTC